MPASPSLPDRLRGALLGLATGDALGTTVEFRPRGSFPPVTDMVGGGPFRLPAGAWTDDTSMALCLGDSLLACRGSDPVDQLRRYVRWWREGHRSSTGACFDIGNTVAAALGRFEVTGDPCSGSTRADHAGNGCLMRLAPVPVYFHGDLDAALQAAEASARTTHGAATCVDATRLLTGMMVQALRGGSKEEVLFAHGVTGLVTDEVRALAEGSWRARSHEEIRGTGYVVDALEAALWCFHRGETWTDAVLLGVNLGDDADTTGAIVGQLAGAFHGAEAIPARWRALLVDGEAIGAMAEDLGAGHG